VTARQATDGPLTGVAETSVYGGRPTFGFVRRETDDGGVVTLYELLPSGQAEARRDRHQRRGDALVTAAVTDVFADTPGPAAQTMTEWNWADWSTAKVARLGGSRLRSVLSLLRESLDEPDAAAITGSGSGGVFVGEATGVRAALGFRAVKPLRRVDRMRSVARGVAQLSVEECYYWYAKCREGSNGERALRTLLIENYE